MDELSMQLHAASPLDDKLYAPSSKEVAFFQRMTGIVDEDRLREHILTIWRDTFQIHPFPCIRIFSFTSLKLAGHFAYEHALHLGRTDTDGLFLDIGCCMGTDVLKLASDGFPAERIRALDLYSDPPTVTDACDTRTLLLSEDPFHELYGNCIAVSAFNLFHLFSWDEQDALVFKIAAFLSRRPRSIVFGSHLGKREKGIRMNPQGVEQYLHSPASWEALWHGEGRPFGAGEVEVKVFLQKPGRNAIVPVRNASDETQLLFWNLEFL
ncbi:hypothetical protein OF83DRAFT_1134644 [Amylostereum chailletii]|nr:hypothetical protein OF83DRAFT_1134644 [Amylostereum chailletii]